MSISLPSLWAYGLGKTRPYQIVGGFLSFSGNFSKSGGAIRTVHIIIANSFQVMVSFLYLFYNNNLTRQVVANEMIRFLIHKKALRVSSPTNVTQRSSYLLSLPWKYAVPQVGLFMLLHLFVSQSVFTVQTRVYGPGPNGSSVPSMDASRIGFSAIGILLSTAL